MYYYTEEDGLWLFQIGKNKLSSDIFIALDHYPPHLG
jgi:hypothetical protein